MPLLGTGMIVAPFLLNQTLKITRGEDPDLAKAFMLLASLGASSMAGDPTLGKSVDAVKGQEIQSAEVDTALRPSEDEEAEVGQGQDDPAVDDLLPQFTPGMEEQIAEGKPILALDARVVEDEGISLTDGGLKRTLFIEQTVVDARYLDYGNLYDLVEMIRGGQLPSIDKAFLALIDVVDAATLGAVHSDLLHWKLQPHLGTRQIKVEIEDRQAESSETQPIEKKGVAHRWDVKMPGADSKVDIELIKEVQDSVQTRLAARQLTFTYHKPAFGTELSSFSGQGEVEAREVKSAIVEEQIDIHREVDRCTATTEVTNAGERVGAVRLSSPAEARDTWTVTTRVFAADTNVLDQVAKGKLTREDLEGLQARLLEERRAPEVVEASTEDGVREVVGARRFLAEDTFSEVGTSESSMDQVMLASDSIPAAHPVMQVAQQEYSALESIAQSLRNGEKPGTGEGLAAAAEAKEVLRTAGVRIEALDTEADDSMVRKASEQREESRPVTREIRTEERSLAPDHKIETETTITDRHRVEREIQGLQVEYAEVAVHEGPGVDGGHAERVLRDEKESRVLEKRTDEHETIKSTREHEWSTVWGIDVGKVLGEVFRTGPTETTKETATSVRTMKVKGTVAEAIMDPATAHENLIKMGVETVDERQGEAMRTSHVAPGGQTEFQEGWIDWVPLGPLATVGMKSSYGLEVTASDVFWATVDVGLTVATAGAGAAVAKSLQGTAKGVAKAVVKGSVKEVGQTLGKGATNLAKAASKDLASTGRDMVKDVNAIGDAGKKLLQGDIKEFTPNVFKSTEKLSLQRSEKLTQSGAKTLAKEDLAHGAKAGAQTTENAAEAVGKRSAEETSGLVHERPTLGGQAKTTAGSQPRGGAYSDVKTPGKHAHHMPSNDASPIPRENGPSISMDPADHRKTASYGNSAEARAYRAKQREFIEQGQYNEALKMDIEDIRSKFGTKYDKEIAEMLDYTKKMRSTQAYWRHPK